MTKLNRQIIEALEDDNLSLVDLALAFQAVMDGMDGYVSEHGEGGRYWDDRKIALADRVRFALDKSRKAETTSV